MLQDKVKAKFEHTMDIIRTEYVLSTKFVKHLEKVGTARSYIARVEKGETDIQISSFFRIARALGIEFIPTFL